MKAGRGWGQGAVMLFVLTFCLECAPDCEKTLTFILCGVFILSLSIYFLIINLLDSMTFYDYLFFPQL